MAVRNFSLMLEMEKRKDEIARGKELDLKLMDSKPSTHSFVLCASMRPSNGNCARDILRKKSTATRPLDLTRVVSSRST